MSSYEKDKDFDKIYIRLEEQEIIYDNDNEKERFLFYTPFVEQKQDTDRSSTLYSINGPMQFFHADVANIRFFQNLPSIQYMRCFALICFHQECTFIKLKKKKKNLAHKVELFYQEIEPK